MGETRNEPDRTELDDLQPTEDSGTTAQNPSAAASELAPVSGTADDVALPDSESVTEEFPPEGLDGELNSEDKPIGGLVIEQDSGEEPVTSSIEPLTTEQAALALESSRQQVSAALFGAERPSQDSAGRLTEDYNVALRVANTTVADEWAAIVGLAAECHAQELTKEQAALAKAAEDTQRHIDTYHLIFSELDRLVDSVGGELEKLDIERNDYQAAPDAVQSTLGNYKKGIEIVNRMLTRARDRKKELGAESPVALGSEMANVAEPATDQFATGVLALSTAFHKLRDANYHIRQDAIGAADACRGTSLTALKSILSAIDGVDSGLANEPEVRAMLAEFEEDAACRTLLESWFGAYERIATYVEQFLTNTGIESHTVEPGTLFDPETMEPQGTVEDSTRNNDEVAVVLRRGFSLDSQLVRPMIVDVVRNP